MNPKIINQLSAKVRNLFSVGLFQRRYGDGKIQVKTLSGRVLEKKEFFPYGFTAKAKAGKVLVFCQGGNFDGFEILPLAADDGVTPPELEEGDTAIYTASGGKVVCRANGDVEINGSQKHFVTFEELDQATAKFMQALNSHTHPFAGSITGGTSVSGTAAAPAMPMGFDISAAKTEKVKTA